MKTFVDSSVWVSVSLGTEEISPRAAAALEGLDEPVIDTTAALETFLVLRSKRGARFAAEALASILATHSYAWVAHTTFRRAVRRAASGMRIGDAAIVENVLANRAKLLTLDRSQAEALGELATLIA